MGVRNNYCITDYELPAAKLCEALNVLEISCPGSDLTSVYQALVVAKILTPMSGVLNLELVLPLVPVKMLSITVPQPEMSAGLRCQVPNKKSWSFAMTPNPTSPPLIPLTNWGARGPDLSGLAEARLRGGGPRRQERVAATFAAR